MSRGIGIATGALLVASALLAACDYVVVPPDTRGGAAASNGWTAVPTRIETTPAGDLVVELAIRNETGLWSAMAADTARVTGPAGTTECGVVKVGTGGHRVAPGLRVRGFQSGPRQELVTEPIRVECAGATADATSVLTLGYTAATGDYDYYDTDASTTSAELSVPLEPLAADLVFPIAETIDGVVEPPDAVIPAINGMTVSLVDVRRTDSGLELDWLADNPGEYPSSVHIGTPPVVGDDGVVYGFWESPDLASVPVTPPGESSAWTTAVDVPADVGGLYLLLSVENGKQRLFANHLLDLTGY